MENIVAIIDQIIQEHKIILQNDKRLEKIANDAGAMVALDKSKQVFMPGRMDQNQGLQKLEELRVKADAGLNAHFNREETHLLEAFQEYGDKKLVEALQTLLLDHTDIRGHLKQIKEEVAELITGRLSRSLWEPKAYDMRAHLSLTHKQIEAHAKKEQILLNKVRKELTETQI